MSSTGYDLQINRIRMRWQIFGWMPPFFVPSPQPLLKQALLKQALLKQALLKQPLFKQALLKQPPANKPTE